MCFANIPQKYKTLLLLFYFQVPKINAAGRFAVISPSVNRHTGFVEAGRQEKTDVFSVCEGVADKGG